MKKLILWITLCGFVMLGLGSGLSATAWAEESAAASAIVADTTHAAATTAAVATAVTVATPTPNKGDTAWMFAATALVILMAWYAAKTCSRY